MSRIKRLGFYYTQLGLAGTAAFVLSKYRVAKLQSYEKYLEVFAGKSGLEIGGPSDYFDSDNILPIYPVVRDLDAVNFSSSTIWEGSLSEGLTFRYDGATRVGWQYIGDAVDLSFIASERYDFAIACNSLEHIANPLKAIRAWLRVLKPGAPLLMVLPNGKLNFDHRRPVTAFRHLIDDYESGMAEDDMTHLAEVLALHDLALDPPAGTLESFHARGLKNYENRALHHHVFDMDLLQEIYDYFGLRVLLKHTTETDFFILGRKT